MDKIQISVDVITGKITQTVTQFTEQELAYSAQINAEIEAQQIKKAQVIANKESALAKLAALGLTQDEVKALVG